MLKSILDFSSAPGTKKIESEVIAGIHEAGNPFYDWFFGSPDSAQKTLAKRATLFSSETSLSRVMILFYEDRPLGGFIGLSGAELQVCRKADMLALIKENKVDSTFNLSERFTAARDLFPPVKPEVYYLSKMWVVHDFRRKGFGREILQGFLESGRAAGFKSFQLDVSADNMAAVCLYRACGFRITQKSRFSKANLEYLSMGLDEE